ncbi:hypothetical protein [Asticcacaulis excentricus]|uniref:Uncharacterized protein n=1 Tax=Asticcacaulis excentricus (strain ATCC 15261 / DSM 4724 / KCTC 12464 / NCIMB 9791 / VKM B-1370 / CB 48) TaxID=573065 RepID=E8RPX7_ASTEC|nr:hypothetical protein [Asticcacaulis excentricus]ADU13150.1 hypothetical protein Astex_1484 [Asticcacaulis excentricus CB 48]
MFDSQPVAALETTAASDEAANVKSWTPWQAVGALVAIAVMAVMLWFVGFHGMIRVVSADAPHHVEETTSAGQTTKTFKTGKPVSVQHLHDYSNNPTQDLNAYPFKSHTAAKDYYDWYLKWYHVVIISFLMAMVAYMGGEALNRAFIPPSSRSEERGDEGYGKVRNFVALVTISMGAVAALGIFVVTEHYKLIDKPHAGSQFNLLPTRPIDDDRWTAGSNALRDIYGALPFDHHHHGYFAFLVVLVSVASFIPVLLTKKAIDNIRVVKALGQADSSDELKELEKELHSIESKKATLPNDHARVQSEIDSLEKAIQPLMEELEAWEAYHLQQADTANADRARKDKRHHLELYLRVLDEYLADLRRKHAHVADKRADEVLSQAFGSAVTDALEPALNGLAQGIRDLELARGTTQSTLDALIQESKDAGQAATPPKRSDDIVRAELQRLNAKIADARTRQGRIDGLLDALLDGGTKIREKISKIISRALPPGKIRLKTWVGEKEVSIEEAKTKKKATERSYLFLLLPTSLLFVLGNIVSAPDLPEVQDIDRFISATGHLKFATAPFLFVNLLIAVLFATIGFGLTEVSAKFVDASFKNMIGRTGALVAPVGVATILCLATGLLPTRWHVKIPALPDNLGYATLECHTATSSTDAIAMSGGSFWFDRDRYILLDSSTQCKIPDEDKSQTNYYVVLGTASVEGSSTHNTQLGNDRADAMMDVVSRSPATAMNGSREAPAMAAFGINLGKYKASNDAPEDRPVREAWEAANSAKDPAEQVRLINDAMIKSAYQRRVVVLKGYSSEVGKGKDNPGVEKAIRDKVCRGEKVDPKAFEALFHVDPTKYEKGEGICSKQPMIYEKSPPLCTTSLCKL